MSFSIERLNAVVDSLPGVSLDGRQALKAFLNTPEVAAIDDREDAARQALRRNAIAERAAIPRVMKTRIDTAVKEAAAAALALRQAEAALMAARDRDGLARGAVNAVDYEFHSKEARLDSYLDETAPPCWDHLATHSEMLLQSTRDLVRSRTWTEGRDFYDRPIRKHESNAEQVIALREEIYRIKGEALAFKRLPLLRHQVTLELHALVLDLQAACEPFGLNLARVGDLGELIVDAHNGSRDLSERATAASRNGAADQREVA